MRKTVKCALITGFLGTTRDRFTSYQSDTTFEQRLAMVARMRGITGVEVVYPNEISDAARLKALVSRHRLSIAAVNVNLKADPRFHFGSVSSKDAAVRMHAIKLLKEGKDLAAASGADKVTCCPLADGYEYSFQINYANAWRRCVESFAEAASYRPEIPLFIEYKPSETRGHCLVDTGAKALCLVNDIALSSVGITVDFGHSLYANETPAEIVSLISDSGVPYYVHINDNDGRWDWDYMAGTRHFIEYAEFLWVLQKLDYCDYLTSDSSPTRLNIGGVFECNANLTSALWRLLAALPRGSVEKLLAQDDYVKTWRFLQLNLLKLS